jgi:hypothetical protein
VPRALVLQEGLLGYRGTSDAGISSYAPDANTGAQGAMAVRTGGEKSALLRFDLGVLPPGAQVSEAWLELYVLGGARAGTLKVYQILRTWEEGQVTWRSSRSGEFWGNAGCEGLWIDRAPVAAAQGALAGTGTWVRLPLTDLVAAWLANPGENHGLLLKAASDISTEYQLATSESVNADWRPRLSLVYGAPQLSSWPSER